MLNPCKANFFTAKELKPRGWLRRQLEIQAEGLSGNLDKIWPDIRDSRWIGGDREGWERVPYWLDGFIPLAWLLDDEDKKDRARRYIDAILARQQEDGWICPCSLEERDRYDMWALFLICKVLVVYHDCSGDGRVEQAVYRALKSLTVHMEHHTLFEWAAARWFECLIPIFWLYERRPEEWLLDLAYTLRVEGFDYNALYGEWRFQEARNRWTQMSHVVNLAMSLKAGALYSRVDGSDPNRLAELAHGLLMRDHGMASGHFTGDECLSGTSPVQGSECCSVVEAMYSYEWLYSVTGNPKWADCLEQEAYNALPATLTPDMWGHQYDQMTNQVQCTRIPEEYNHFRTNSGESHLFGLEPNYGCCTANFNQGWPKLALATLFRTAEGIAVGAIAPCRLETEIAGVPVVCEIVTSYPFADGYRVEVTAEKPVEFTLDLRLPGFAKAARVDGKEAAPGSIYSLRREFSGRAVISVECEFKPEFAERPSGLYCVRRGPLLYSVKIGEQARRLEYTRGGVERKFPYCDYELLPTTPWNYGFADRELTFRQGAVGPRLFDPEQAPVSITARLAPVEWELLHGVCAEKPVSNRPVGQAREVALIPYGCTNLRMTELPFVE